MSKFIVAAVAALVLASSAFAGPFRCHAGTVRRPVVRVVLTPVRVVAKTVQVTGKVVAKPLQGVFKSCSSCHNGR